MLEHRLRRRPNIETILGNVSFFMGIHHPTQQTRDIEPLLVQCWSTVYDAGPTLNQQWLNVSCLLGS